MSKRFAVVDIETTGALVRRDRITEIGIVVTDGTKVLDEYSSLVNPGISIPPFITKITGITDEMVADAPPFYMIAKKIVEMTEGCIFVAHNVRFDYGFLRASFEELGYAFNKKRLCTVQLARKTLDLPKYNLGSLIKHYDIKVESRHRALDDARAAAIVLQNLLEKDINGTQFDQEINRGVREALLPPTITLEDLHGLPEDPGVYYFRDSDQDIVYIGKSKNIQKRVMSHFSKTTRKAAVLQRRVSNLDFVLTGSDLLAQIIEALEIKKHKPEINRAQRTSSFQHMLITKKNERGYIRFELTTKVGEEDKILNAYPTKRSGFSMLNYLVNEYMLCPTYTHLENGMGPCTLHQIDKCRGACFHDETPEDYNKRAEDARNFANNLYKKDFVIIDTGRNSSEKSLIIVKDGIYKGHAYIDIDHQVNNAQEWMDHITPQLYYPEINSMIRRYIDQGGGETIVYF